MNQKHAAQKHTGTGIKWLILICILFAELLVHTWVRTESTQTILDISSAQARLSTLLSYQKELTLERDRLRSDDRIIRIAASQLNMTNDVFNQTIYLKKENL